MKTEFKKACAITFVAAIVAATRIVYPVEKNNSSQTVEAADSKIKTYDQLVNAASKGGTYTIADSIAVEKKITIPGGKKLTLIGDTNYLIKTKQDLAVMFDVEGTLTLDNSIRIKGGVNDDYNVSMAVIRVKSGGTLTINDATIYKSAGNAIRVTEGGTFNFKGGSITDNKGIYEGCGGAVLVKGNSTFNMSGGSISKSVYGAVCVNKGSTFNMSGGTITNNTIGAGNINTSNTANNYGYGGGVFCNGSFNMSGGTIKNNTASKQGGGICLGVSGVLTLKKDACVLGDSNNAESNDIYFSEQSQIYIESVLNKRILLNPAEYENGFIAVGSNILEAEQYINCINLSKTGWYLKAAEKNALLSQKFSITYKDPAGSQEELKTDIYYKDVQTTPNWIKTGYILKGWSKTVNGSVLYTPEQDIEVTDNLSLYAIWEEKTINLFYDVGEASNCPENTTYLFSEGFVISNKEPEHLGYNFAGWYLNEDYTGNCYAGGSTVILNTDSDVTLYAKWEAKTISLNYNANGGYNAPGGTKTLYTDSFVISDIEPKKTGYTFVGWNTEKDGTGISYTAGDEIVLNELNSDADITLYAIWEEKTITLSYDLNNGSGNIEKQTLLYADSITKGFAITSTVPEKDGYTFTGWFLDKNCTSTIVYAPGGNIKLSADQEEDIILYAGWNKVIAAVEGDSNIENTTTNVNVSNTASNLKLNKTSVKLGKGESTTLKVSNAIGSITYTSSAPKVAIIGNDGTIVALKKGTAKISVTSGGNTKQCTVKVYAAPSKVTAKYTKKTLKKGKKLKLSYSLPSGSYGSVSFSSSNKKIASVNSSGTVTAKKKGTAKVTIKTYNGKKAVISITVK